MKILILILLFCTSAHAFTWSPQEENGPINVEAKLQALKERKHYSYKYDKFTDRSTLFSKPKSLLSRGESFAASFARGMSRGTIGPQPDLPPTKFALTVGFTFMGKDLKESPQYLVAFLSDSRNWSFLKDRFLYAFIDGERLPLGEGKHDADIYLGGVTEHLIFLLTEEQMKKIAEGKSVEIKVGGFERKLKPEVIERFRGLLSLANAARRQ